MFMCKVCGARASIENTSEVHKGKCCLHCRHFSLPHHSCMVKAATTTTTGLCVYRERLRGEYSCVYCWQVAPPCAPAVTGKGESKQTKKVNSKEVVRERERSCKREDSAGMSARGSVKQVWRDLPK